MQWIDIMNVWDQSLYFHIFISKRGPGKTYSALSALAGLRPDVFDPTGRFMLVRRTEKDCAAIAADDSILNPFKSINFDFGSNITIKKSSSIMWGIHSGEEDNQKHIGYLCALSSAGAVSSMDFPDVDYILYDEFIKKPSVRAIKDEAGLLMGLYESVNRNREFKGSPAVHLIMLANSLNIYNDYMVSLSLVAPLEKMIRKNGGYGAFYDRKRSLEVHLLKTSQEFDDAKQNTAIARLAKGTAFGAMAYDNKFSYNDFSLVEHKNIKGMHPIVMIDNFYVWADDNKWYCSYAPGNVVRVYSSENMHDRISLKRTLSYDFIRIFSKGKVFFESYEIKYKMIDILINNY